MDSDLIYTGEAVTLILPDVKLGEDLLTELTDVDNFVYTVIGQGITGDMIPSPDIPGTWIAELAEGIPTAGRHTIRAIATKGTREGVWELFQWIHNRSL